MDNCVFDTQDVLRRIQGDKELLSDLVDIFLAETPRCLEEIKGLRASLDFTALANAAHSGKGSSSNIGAKKLWQSFKVMEEAAQQKNITVFEEYFDKALLEFSEFKDAALTVKLKLSDQGK